MTKNKRKENIIVSAIVDFFLDKKFRFDEDKVERLPTEGNKISLKVDIQQQMMNQDLGWKEIMSGWERDYFETRWDFAKKVFAK